MFKQYLVSVLCLQLNLFSNLFHNVYSITLEQQLTNELLESYDKLSIPVKKNNHSVDLFFGQEINGLVYFNQKDEKIKFNMLSTLIWRDEYLNWEDLPKYKSIDYIFIPSYKLWQPDLELYNSGSSPELFELYGNFKVYKNGFIIYNRPTAFTFSCKLKLQVFPFDSQECTMLFGSWKYPKAILNLRPFNYKEIETLDSNFRLFKENVVNIKNISISPYFSHNEWTISEIKVFHKDYEYLCCPGDLWPNSEFTIILKRSPHKYTIMIIMAIFITLSSLTINLIKVSNYVRTYILVFIPLTLIWLQIHISSKIPVIKYPTKLENIIQLCFYVTIISAFESGIVYNILQNEYKIINRWFKKRDFDKVQNDSYLDFNSITKNTKTDVAKNLYYDKFYNMIYMFDKGFRALITLIYIIFLIKFISID